jgi:hypothetical protein
MLNGSKSRLDPKDDNTDVSRDISRSREDSGDGHAQHAALLNNTASIVRSRNNTVQGGARPRPKKGMLDKVASSMMKNWRTRYFTLEEGVLTYFDPVKWFVKGQYDLYGLEFYTEENDPPEYIRLRGANRPEICLKCKDAKNRGRWYDAIQDHIEYANAKGKASIIERFSTAEPRFNQPGFNQPGLDEPQQRFTCKTLDFLF